jgi:hypothetical protein
LASLRRYAVSVGRSTVFIPASRTSSPLGGNDHAMLGTIVDMNAGASRLAQSGRRQGGLQALI